MLAHAHCTVHYTTSHYVDDGSPFTVKGDLFVVAHQCRALKTADLFNLKKHRKVIHCELVDLLFSVHDVARK